MEPSHPRLAPMSLSWWWVGEKDPPICAQKPFQRCFLFTKPKIIKIPASECDLWVTFVIDFVSLHFWVTVSLTLSQVTARSPTLHLLHFTTTVQVTIPWPWVIVTVTVAYCLCYTYSLTLTLSLSLAWTLSFLMQCRPVQMQLQVQ